jgi:hypothetical protein
MSQHDHATLRLDESAKVYDRYMPIRGRECRTDHLNLVPSCSYLHFHDSDSLAYTLMRQFKNIMLISQRQHSSTWTGDEPSDQVPAHETCIGAPHDTHM